MTLLKLDKELLMFLVSSRRWPVLFESFSLSEPARSTRLRVPVQDSLVIELFPVILSIKTECDLDDLSLQLVAATERFFCARWSKR